MYLPTLIVIAIDRIHCFNKVNDETISDFSSFNTMRSARGNRIPNHNLKNTFPTHGPRYYRSHP